jgi:uncharacterized caspase-like protein
LPTLYYLAAGVSEHSRPELTLKYPAADVAGVGEVLMRQRGRVFGEVKTRILSNREASREAITSASKDFFAGAELGDVAVIFVAGHGMTTDDKGYYFVAHDTDPEQLPATGVSWSFFDGLLNELKCNRLLLADTCHSALIRGRDGWRQRARGDGNEFLRESRATGAFVFAASTGEGVSREDDAWGHGAFAKALIDGLSGAAVLAPEKKVELGVLRSWVISEVGRLTATTQKPVFADLSGGADLLGLVLAVKD